MARHGLGENSRNAQSSNFMIKSSPLLQPRAPVAALAPAHTTMSGVYLLLALAVLAQCCSEALGGISVTPSRSPFVCDDGTAKSGSDELLIWGGAWAHAPELPGAQAGAGPETVYQIEARSIVRISAWSFRLAPRPQC